MQIHHHFFRQFGFAVRLSAFYGAVFLLIGLLAPYFPVWLASRSLTPQEIGFVLAVPLIVRILVTPPISLIADQTGDRRRVLIFLAIGTFLGFCLFFLTGGFWSVLAVAIFVALFWTSIMPVTEAVAMQGVKNDGHDYGRMRLWGSLTFIAASFAGGFAIERSGGGAVLYLIVGSTLLIVIAAFLLPKPQGKGRLKAATQAYPIKAADAARLLCQPMFLLFLIATGLVQAAHAVYYAFGTIHWQSQGISTEIIGALWAIGVIAEILLFLVSGWVVRRVGIVNLICIAALAAVLRWSLTAFSMPLAALFAVQTLHGLTFGAAHLAAVHFIGAAIPEEAASTAQGLYASVGIGLLMGGGLMAAGPLYASLDAQAYLVMAAVSVVSLALALCLRFLWKGQVLVDRG